MAGNSIFNKSPMTSRVIKLVSKNVAPAMVVAVLYALIALYLSGSSLAVIGVEEITYLFGQVIENTMLVYLSYLVIVAVYGVMTSKKDTDNELGAEAA